MSVFDQHTFLAGVRRAATDELVGLLDDHVRGTRNTVHVRISGMTHREWRQIDLPANPRMIGVTKRLALGAGITVEFVLDPDEGEDASVDEGNATPPASDSPATAADGRGRPSHPSAAAAPADRGFDELVAWRVAQQRTFACDPDESAGVAQEAS